MSSAEPARVKISVVGVGGAGGNAILRMARSRLQGVELLAVNTDVQALGQIKGVRTFAIGPRTTGGMGSGGRPDLGRKAIKESQEQITQLMEGMDMVFVTAGMGGGTGTGAASVVAEIAKRQGALTVGMATLPFSFEGQHRRSVASEGMHQLAQKVDTLIVVDNDRLLPSLNGKVPLQKAFQLADEVLRQGVQGVTDIITVPGLINVDFADVKAVMSNRGPSFLALGEGKGRAAAVEAAHMALSNPLFDAPLEGATGILFNVRGGKDLTLAQVHEVAAVIRKASRSHANIVFGVVQERRSRNRVSIALVATGVKDPQARNDASEPTEGKSEEGATDPRELARRAASNGHASHEPADSGRLL